MTTSDSVFSGPVPQLYNENLGPILFEAFASAVAERLTGRETSVLETAAGTGIVTRAIATAVPNCMVTATDLNQAMLDVAAAGTRAGNVRWQQADGQSLPFPDRSFDAVVCGFGVMFMPDKRGAYREARRVLRAEGRFLFTVWDRLEANPLMHVADETVAGMFADDPPRFIARTPCGYHDKARIEADLRDAGFTRIEIETVSRESTVADALQPAVGLTQGTPLRGEIEARDPDRLLDATNRTAAALRKRFGEGAFRVPLQALMVSASA